MPPPQPLHNVAYTVAEALRNPYAHPSSMSQFHNPYSMHYANAYLQSQSALCTTPEGYALSSAYRPYASMSVSRHSTAPQPAPSCPPQQNSSWYQPGNMRCAYPQCRFTGSTKSVEIHMMDRHLIYPPGWNKEKKRPGWDADPSLKGKTIPIQGTSIVLNSPEALNAWVAERKKRWPTAQRVEEKKVNLEEAIARGQLPLVGSNPRGTKRRREEVDKYQHGKKRCHRSSVHQVKNSTDRTLGRQETHIIGAKLAPAPSEAKPDAVGSRPVQCLEEDSTSDNDDDDNGAPEVVSSKLPPVMAGLGDTFGVDTEESRPASNSSQTLNQASSKPNRKEPKLPPRNPFASRPTLLRNLILPEVRITVSNLSQAIRFLVDNDFFRGVELKPGQADHNIIEVVGSSDKS